MTHSIQLRHDSFSSATWLRHIYDSTLLRVCHDPFITSVTRFLLMCDVTQTYFYLGHVVNIYSVPCVPWLIHHIYDVTHSHVRRDSDIFTTRLYYYGCTMTHSLHVWRVPHAYMRRDSFSCATWLRHIYDMTLLRVCHDPFITSVTWLILICDVTQTYTYLWHVVDVYIYNRIDKIIGLFCKRDL